MGNTFSEQKLKARLKMSLGRLKLLQNKKNNEMRVLRREIANLLVDNKVESATVRCEGVVRAKNEISVYELLSIQCDLLAQRTPFIASSSECPDDLFEAIATIVYASSRTKVPEFSEIMRILAAKYSAEWIGGLRNNPDFVNARVRKALELRSPDHKAVRQLLVEIAEQFEIEWGPSESKESIKDEPIPYSDLYPDTQADESMDEVDSLAARFEQLKKQ